MERKRKIVPPVYLLLCIVAMLTLDHYLPVKQIVVRPWSLLGLVPIALGLLMAAYSAGAFVKAGTPVVPFEPSKKLVVSGFYRISRNPMYLGMVFLLFGIAVVLGTVGALLPIPVFIGIIQMRFIVGEERFLESIFGSEYLHYKKSVRRWL